jgi:peptidyl-prolyl cis-trans isomerase SurA
MKFLFPFVLAFFFSLSSLSAQTVVDRIVADVDGEIILDSEVNALVFNALREQQVEPTQEVIMQVWKDALNELINQKVLLSAAKQDTTIKIEDRAVEERLDRQIGQMAAQLGGNEKLEAEYGKSILQIKADYRDIMRDQMMVQEYRGKKVDGIKITPSEVRDYFNKLPLDSIPPIPETARLAHIVRLPKISETAKNNARMLAQAVRDSLLAGKRIEDLAKRYSDDPGSKNTGGRGTAKLSELVPEFSAVASSLPRGAISQVFQTQFGMHVMRVNSLDGDQLDYSHVLIKIDDRSADPAEAVAFLKQLRDSIQTHKVPFEAIAKRHSQDPNSAPFGGYVVNPQSGARDLNIAALSPSWKRALAKVQIGQISEPEASELSDGRKAWHIVWLQKKTPQHKLNLNDDFKTVEDVALQSKQEQVLQSLIGRLRQQTYIRIYE